MMLITQRIKPVLATAEFALLTLDDVVHSSRDSFDSKTVREQPR